MGFAKGFHRELEGMLRTRPRMGYVHPVLSSLHVPSSLLHLSHTKSDRDHWLVNLDRQLSLKTTLDGHSFEDLSLLDSTYVTGWLCERCRSRTVGICGRWLWDLVNFHSDVIFDVHVNS